VIEGGMMNIVSSIRFLICV